MIHFIKQHGQLKPVYKADLERWEKVKENIVYCMRAERDRNHKHHSKLFAIAQGIIDNLPDDNPWSNKESYQLIKASEIPLGYVEEIISLDGEVSLIPESISFEKWSQEKFEGFYNKVIQYWAEKFGDWVIEIEAGEF
ncbi:MAG: hypothetical protein M0P71_17600 [Melioribacteraceae bacterium]|jgi:hypothetical protein|nr:hypothetical protein [Melioribacteraceae bacterium]